MAEAYGYEALRKEMLAMVPEQLDKREGSVIDTTVSPVAYEIARQLWMIGELFGLLFADTSQGEWLDRVVYDFGLERQRATQAVRKIRVFDQEGGPMQLRLGDRFAKEGLVFSVIDGDEQPGSYLVRCQQAGTEGNEQEGVLLPVDHLVGLGYATLEAEPVYPAQPEETDDQLRERFYRHVRRAAFGGNIAQYEQQALSIEGIGRVKVFSAPLLGPGQVGLMVGDEAGKPVSGEMIEKVQEFFGEEGKGVAPIGHRVTVKTPALHEIAVQVSLQLKDGVQLKEVQNGLRQAAQVFFDQEGFEESMVYRAKLQASLLNAEPRVLDIPSLTLNGAEGNLELDKSFDGYEIPKLSNITFVLV